MNAREGFIKALEEAIRPDETLSVSKWAERHRILPADSPEPGPWRNNRTPYLIEIMDSLSAKGGVRETYLKKGHQLGGSASTENAVASWITMAAGNILGVFATLEDAEKWNLSRFEPMRESSAELRKRILDANIKGSDNTQRRKKFPGGFMQLVGANRPGGLKSSTMRYVLLEEMDEYAGDIGDQGAPEDLAKNRTSNFGKKARIFGNSTPTIEDASPIDRNYLRGDQRKCYMRCPYCDHPQFFEWKGFKWPKGKPEEVGYACNGENCGVVSSEAQWKVKNYTSNSQDEYPFFWQATAVGEPGVRSYHLPSFYAPLGWRPWPILAAEFVAAGNDPIKLKKITNNEWAECWQNQSKSMDDDVISKRAGSWGLRTIPVGCLFLVMSVDVQAYRLEYKILGFGRNKKCWVIDYSVIDGNPAREEVWQQLTEIRRKPIENAYGISMRPRTVGIDSGGHHTQEVYSYARMFDHEGVFALKGSSQRRRPIIGGRPSVVDVNRAGQVIKGGVKLWSIGTDTAKDMLFGYLNADSKNKSDEHFIHFPAGLGKDYYRQLTAEVYDEKKGYVKKTGRRNEAIDLFVYGFAAAFHPDVRLDVMKEPDWAHLERIFEPKERDLFELGNSVQENEIKQTPQPVEAAPVQTTPLEADESEFGNWLNGYELNH